MNVQGFFRQVTHYNQAVNQWIWGVPGLALLIATGVIMTCRTGCFQFVHSRHWLRATVGKLFTKQVIAHTDDKASISQFQALCTALAATVGVGNIAGVAAAIVTGGPGAVFWMWVAALFGMMTSFSENVLGIFYRRKVNGQWAGGAMYYLQDGVGRRKGCPRLGRCLATLFAGFTVLASFGMGNMGQVNKIVANLESAFAIPALSSVVLYDGVTLYSALIGAGLLVLMGRILYGGMQRTAAVAEAIVPVMILLFVLGSVTVIGVNHQQIGPAFAAIFQGAFCGEALWGGAAGVSLRQVIAIGFKRGVFSNEAGLGSGVMAHACAKVQEPVQQGMWGIFEVFTDTIVLCTMTALVILTGGTQLPHAVSPNSTADATLVAHAFGSVFGITGERFVALALLLFAFTTVLGWSQYGAKAAEYLGGAKAKRIYRAVFVTLVLAGALMTSSLAWDISDTFNGLMMLPNLVGILTLSGQVRTITQNYIDRHIKHTVVAPLLSYDPRIQRQMARGE